MGEIGHKKNIQAKPIRMINQIYSYFPNTFHSLFLDVFIATGIPSGNSTPCGHGYYVKKFRLYLFPMLRYLYELLLLFLSSLVTKSWKYCFVRFGLHSL